jgi:hypothetical protein
MTIGEITWQTDFDYNVDGMSRMYQDMKIGYDRLVDLFGEPERINTDEANPSSRVQWIVEFSDGEGLTIYDWKQNAVPVEEVTEWNIGGRSTVVAGRIFDILNKTPIFA